MTLASTIIDRVSKQLIDEGKVYWTDAELLRWVSDGQRVIVATAPATATPTLATVTLVAGVKQSLPANAQGLIGVYRNTTGRAVVAVPRDVLDNQNPTWTTETAAVEVKAYTYDANDPTKFYVYPPNTGAGSVEINYAIMPPELTTVSETLLVRDQYVPALVDYVMWRAHMKESDFAAGQGLATLYQNAFVAQLPKGA